MLSLIMLMIAPDFLRVLILATSGDVTCNGDLHPKALKHQQQDYSNSTPIQFGDNLKTNKIKK
jgi:hypothetical protein